MFELAFKEFFEFETRSVVTNGWNLNLGAIEELTDLSKSHYTRS
jgi:hypothetical protein